MADKNEDDDDDAVSAKEAVFQDLFGDDTSNRDNDDEEPQHHSIEVPSTQTTNVFLQRSVMHVVKEEQQVGGSIA
jgi:hypothetical protein